MDSIAVSTGPSHGSDPGSIPGPSKKRREKGQERKFAQCAQFLPNETLKEKTAPKKLQKNSTQKVTKKQHPKSYKKDPNFTVRWCPWGL